jgi:hypothetical protein
MLWWAAWGSRRGRGGTRRAASKRATLPGYGARMSRPPFEELVHRVNNLLGTIELQAEVARGEGTIAAYASALEQIVESARRTQHDLARLRASRGGAGDGS